MKTAPILAQLQPDPQREYKINVLRLKPGIGDIAMIGAALRGLREKFPNSTLTLSVLKDYKNGAIYDTVKYLPYVDRIIDYKNGDKQYHDYTVDISSQAGEISHEIPKVHSPERVDIWSNYLGAIPTDKRPFVYVTAKEKQEANSLLESYLKKGLMGFRLVYFGLTSNTDHRNIKQEIYKEAAKTILEKHNDVVIVASTDFSFSDLYEHPRLINLHGLTTRQFISILSLCEISVTPDTGTLHLGGGFDQKMVGLWGPTHPESRTTYYKNTINIWHKNVCGDCPCWYNVGRCQNRKCLDAITSLDIINGVETHLRTSDTRSFLYNSASVVVIDTGDEEQLARCKRTIELHSGFCDYEIIIPSKGEYNKMCEEGLKKATKEFVVFIESSYRAKAGWLPRLFYLFERHGENCLGGSVVFTGQNTNIVYYAGSNNGVDYCKGKKYAEPQHMLRKVDRIDKGPLIFLRSLIPSGIPEKVVNSSTLFDHLVSEGKFNSFIVGNSKCFHDGSKEITTEMPKGLPDKQITSPSVPVISRLSNPSLTILGPVMWRDGLGRITVSACEGLFDITNGNVFVSMLPGSEDFAGIPSTLENVQAEIQFMKGMDIVTSKVLTTGILWTGTDNHAHKIHRQLGIAQEMRSRGAKYLMGISMLESSKIPDKWVEIINENYDEILVPCDYLVEVYRNCGVQKKLSVVPLPIHGIEEMLNRPVVCPSSSSFTFGCLSGGWTRKGIPMLIRAFLEGFPRDRYQDLRLKIHSRFGDDFCMKEIKQLADYDTRINFTSGVVAESYIEKWKEDINCFVLPSAGEGFSFTPREMLARGIPCLISSGHAHDVIIQEEGAVGIKIGHTQPAFYGYFGLLGHEWVPDFNDLIDKMQDIYCNYNKYKQQVLESRDVLVRYEPKNWARMYKDILL